MPSSSQNNSFGGGNFPNFGDFSQNIPNGDFSGFFGGAMQIPDGMTPPSGGLFGDTAGNSASRPTDNFRPESMNAAIPGGMAGGTSSADWLSIGVSVLLLATALVIVKKYRR